MQNYLVVTLSGVIFLTFIELILPKGSMKDISKMVISLMVVVIILLPLISIIKGDYIQNKEFNYDKNYYEYLQKIEEQTIINQINTTLKQQGYTDYEINFSLENNGEKNITIIFNTLGIITQTDHINNVETLKETLQKYYKDKYQNIIIIDNFICQ